MKVHTTTYIPERDHSQAQSPPESAPNNRDSVPPDADDGIVSQSHDDPCHDRVPADEAAHCVRDPLPPEIEDVNPPQRPFRIYQYQVPTLEAPPCSPDPGPPDTADDNVPRLCAGLNSDRPGRGSAPCGRPPSVPQNRNGTAAQQDNGFDPANIYYESPSSVYYVGVGTGFSKYSRRAPVIHGIMKYLKSRNQRNEGNQDFKRLAEGLLADIETTRAVAWAGSIAGYPPGRHIYGDTALLVTQGPRLIDPVPGDIPVTAIRPATAAAP